MTVERILSLLVLIVKLSCERARMKMGAYMTTIECSNYLPELVTNLSCHLDRPSQFDGTFSVELELAKDVKAIKGVYIFSVQRGSSITNYSAIELDYCQALSSLQSQFLLRMIASELRRSSNFPLQCPFKMKRYYINKYSIDPKVIPSYAPELNFISDCQISLNKQKAIRLIIHGRVAQRRSGR